MWQLTLSKPQGDQHATTVSFQLAAQADCDYNEANIRRVKLFYDNLEPDWTDEKIGCRTIDNTKVVTTEATAGLLHADELEVRWGEHNGTQWLYACDDMFALGTAYKNLNVPEPDYRHRFTLRSLRLTAPDSAIALVATFSLFRATGADRIADALGLFTLLTTQFEYSPRAVEFALSRLDGFASCRYRILK